MNFTHSLTHLLDQMNGSNNVQAEEAQAFGPTKTRPQKIETFLEFKLKTFLFIYFVFVAQFIQKG